MALQVYANKTKRYGLGIQAVYGTPISTASACVELACEATITDRDIKIRESDSSHGARFKVASQVVHDTKRSAPKVSIKGVLKMKEIDHLIYMFFQNVTEGDNTPFDKTFAFGSAQPDFTASAGYFMSFIERSPIASQSILVKDCICSSLKLTGTPGEMVMYEAELIGRGAASITYNPTGSWTVTANDYLYPSDTKRYRDYVSGWIDDRAPADAGWELSLTQDITLLGNDGSGDFEMHGITNRGGTLLMPVLENSAAKLRLQTAHDAGTQMDFNIGFGHDTPGTDDGDFDITLSGKVTKSDFDNAAILGATIEVDLIGDDATTVPITLIMANLTDRTW